MTKLTLHIEGSPYQLTRLCGPGVWLVTGYRDSYTVTRTADRITCTCPQYFHRCSKTASDRCKHGAGLVESGILDGYAQIPEDPHERLDSSVPPDRDAAQE